MIIKEHKNSNYVLRYSLFEIFFFVYCLRILNFIIPKICVFLLCILIFVYCEKFLFLKIKKDKSIKKRIT